MKLPKPPKTARNHPQCEYRGRSLFKVKMAVKQEHGLPKSALRANALGLADVLMQGITHTAPATAVLLTIQFISSNAGVTAPLAYLVAFLIVLPLGVSLAQLAKHFPSAGGYYTYVSRTVHPRAGFLTAWLYFLYSAVTPAFSLAMMGGVLESSLKTEFGFVFPWWLFLLFGTGFTYWVTSRGIEISAKSLMILGAIEMGIVVLLAVWSLSDPGSGGVNVDSFNPSRAPSGGGFYLAVVFSIFALTGWEGVVPLAEESAHPRQIMPRAIMGTIIIMGGYLVFTSWGLLIGWGTNDVNNLVASQEMPFFQLAKRFWGPGWIVILFALLNSMLAVAVATTLVSTRMWYAMARSGCLPESLARIHPGYKTPVRAIIFQSLVTLAVGPGLGFWIGPQQEYVLMGTVLTLALVLIYCAGNLGVFLHYRNHRRAEFQPVLHAVFPLLSSVAVLWVGYKSVVPLPPAPVTYAPVIVAGWLALGVCVLAVMKWSGREQWLEKAGRVFEETTGATGAPDPGRDQVGKTQRSTAN